MNQLIEMASGHYNNGILSTHECLLHCEVDDSVTLVEGNKGLCAQDDSHFILPLCGSKLFCWPFSS